MPDQIKTIGAAGDYSTIALWEAAADVSTGYWKGELVDGATYSENVVISGPTGVPSATNYIWLDVQANVRHAGVHDVTKAKIESNVSGSHIIEIDVDYTRITHQQIHQASTGDSDEGIRIRPGTVGVVISRNIITANEAPSNQDGIYFEAASDASSSTAYIDNNIIYGWTRSGIHAQNWQGSGTFNCYGDVNTVVRCGAGMRAHQAGSNVTNMIVHNTAVLDGLVADRDYYTYSGSPVWSGSNNIGGDGGTSGAQSRFGVAGSFDNVNLVTAEPASGENFWVNSTAVGSEDFRLAGENAFTVSGNGINRIGSEPDSRQDFSVDIAGVARDTTTPDIGASEYAVASGPVIVSRSLSEDVVVTDPSLSLARQFIRKVLASFDVFDSLQSATIRSSIERVLESVVLVVDDTVDIDRVFIRALLNSLDVQQTLESNSLVFRHLSEYTDVLDTVISKLQGRIVSAILREEFGVSDAAQVTRDFVRGLLESATASDNFSAASFILRVLHGDNVIVDDSVFVSLQGKILRVLLGDDIPVTEDTFFTTRLTRELLASIVVADSLAKELVVFRLLAESADVSDEVIANLIRQLTEVLLVDNLGVNDRLSRTLSQLLVAWGIIETEIRIEPIDIRVDE